MYIHIHILTCIYIYICTDMCMHNYIYHHVEDLWDTHVKTMSLNEYQLLTSSFSDVRGLLKQGIIPK